MSAAPALANPTFIVVGDVQRTLFLERLALRGQHDAARRAVLDEIARQQPAFVLFLGDTVARGSREKDWRHFDDLTEPLRRSGIPLHAILGNHDYMGAHDRALASFFARFPALEGRRWGHFRFGALAIVRLDSNIARLAASEREEQERWYAHTIAELDRDPEVAAIAVACHHPPFTNSTIVSDNREVVRRFLPDYLRAAKPGLFFSGHSHSYEHFAREGKHFVVSGGGGGPRQRVRVATRRRRHVDLHCGGPWRPFHFCRVTVAAGDVQVEMVGVDDALRRWTVGDAFRVSAGPGGPRL